MKIVVSKEGEILQKVYHDVSADEGIGIIANECTHGAIDPLLLVEMKFSGSGKIKTILYTFSEEQEGLK
jgi:hypothetical protein